MKFILSFIVDNQEISIRYAQAQLGVSRVVKCVRNSSVGRLGGSRARQP